MKVTLLPNETAARTGFTHSIQVTHADLTEPAANTSQALTAFTLKPGYAVMSAATYLRTAFKNSADSAFNTTAMIVGDDNSTNRFIVSQELNINGTVVYHRVHPSTLPQAYNYAARPCLVTVSAMTGKSLVDLDTGEVLIFLKIIPLVEISALIATLP